MEEQAKDISAHIAAIKQRKLSIFVISSVVFIVSVAIALAWPPTYRSSATILIEQQEIPSDLVRSTVTSYASERIQSIQAQVMSRTNLLKIIDKFDLYIDDRKLKTTDEIIERMREDTALNIVSADVLDPRTGRPGQATIAFELSFDGEAPQAVQRVASELTTLYLNENLKSRAKKAEETSKFLNEESTRLGNLITQLEKELAVFKQNNSGLLPGLQQLNMQMLQRLETEHATLTSNIQSLKEQKVYLVSQLASLENDIPGAADRLQLLEAEYAVAQSRYSPEHPDVQRLLREIDVLKNQPVDLTNSASTDNEIKLLKLELLQLKKKYTDSHPDVSRIRDKIKHLESESKNTGNKSNDSNPNPAYVSLKTQIEGMAIELNITEEKERITRQKIAELEDKLSKMPQVEREYLALTRDYENAVTRYQDTKAKGMQADVAKQLETEKKGERFTLIDPPALPEKPIKPNRPAIIFLGLMLSLGSGFGFALLSDSLSGVVRGAKHLESILGVAPLAVVPLQLNAMDMLNKSRLKKKILILSFLSLLLIAALIHFFISPLDVLWFRSMRKLEIITS